MTLLDEVKALLAKECQVDRIERKLDHMGQLLDTKLAELSSDDDAIIALITTDNTTITSLQAANAALIAQQGSDSADAAKVQALIDKLVPVLPAPTVAAGATTAASTSTQ